MAQSTQDLIRSGAAAVSSGKEVTSDNIEIGGSEPSNLLTDMDSEDSVLRAENSTVDSSPIESSESPESEQDQSAESEGEAATSQATSDSKKASSSSSKETITVTDEKGRRKIEIDLNDKEQVKKYVQMAYGARKWQAERDQALTSRKQLESELAQVKQNWDTLEKAFQEGGEEAVVDLIAGKRGAYQEKIKQRIMREEFLRNASPEEVEALKAKEAAEKSAKELEKIRKENEEFRQKMAAEKEQAELRSLESTVHPVFNKYRFAEKLGSADDEQMFDEMLWNTALKRLEPYEEKGLALTPELVEREFSVVAKSIRSRIGLQAEKKAAKVIEQKKKEATENVQATVKSGYKTGALDKEAGDLLNSGNLTGLLKGWNKYGSVFNGGKK
jgi:hypothetical protein